MLPERSERAVVGVPASLVALLARLANFGQKAARCGLSDTQGSLMSGVPVVMSGVPVDIPESFPLPHGELTGPETLSYRCCRRPVRAIFAAEVQVWRDSLRAVRGMSRQSAVASVTSGLICGLVMFVFCVVFSNMIFGQHELLIRAVPLGVAAGGDDAAKAKLGGGLELLTRPRLPEVLMQRIVALLCR